MIVRLLTKHHLERLSLNGDSFESTLVKMPHRWKSHAMAQLLVCLLLDFSLTVKAVPRECVIRTSQP